MKYTLITGASSGIGKAMAFEFASKGHNLILVARRRNLLEIIKRDIETVFKVNVMIEVVDLSDINEVEALWNRIDDKEIETLINNAGFGDINKIQDVNIDKINKMINVNIHALTHLTLRFMQKYKDTEGTIMNVGAVVGYRHHSLFEIFAATKYYVSAFTESLISEAENSKTNLRIKILAPGSTRSEFLEHSLEDSKWTTEELKIDEQLIKSSDELGSFAYKLYKSDKKVGIILGEKFILRDEVFRKFPTRK